MAAAWPELVRRPPRSKIAPPLRPRQPSVVSGPACQQSKRRVAVIGAGISGLAAAHRIVEQSPTTQVVLFESSERAGGVLQTVERDGYLIERSADSFLTKLPWASDLCRRVGLADELLPTDESRRKALVIRAGRIVPAPAGFVLMAPKQIGSVLSSPVLSPSGKLRLACEPFISRRRAAAGDDESVASFARRRLGRQAFERLVQPLLAGIYTADPEKLSMAATMPQFIEQEAKHGSLVLAARRESNAQKAESNQTSGARYGLFQAPRHGMQQLVDAIVAKLPPGSLRLNAVIESVVPADNGWKVQLANEGIETAYVFDAVVIATPAHRASQLVAEAKPELGDVLGQIEYAGCSIVCFGFDRGQIGAELPGFGFVVPTVERRRLIAASFASLKFPGRSPSGQLLVRAFVGGALQPELANLEDEPLRQLVLEELRDLVHLNGDPIVSEIARWPSGMPQYHVGHVGRVERIESLTAQTPGLELAGAAYRGVGIPQCIHSGELAAERTLAWLQASA